MTPLTMANSWGIAFRLEHARTTILHPRSRRFPAENFQTEDTYMPFASVSRYSPRGSALCTCLNYIAYWVQGDLGNQVVYLQYCLAVLSGHKHDDSLGEMSS